MAAPMTGTFGALSMALRVWLCRSAAIWSVFRGHMKFCTNSPVPLVPSCPAVLPLLLPGGVRLLRDFLSPEEEGSLLKELERPLAKGRYQDGHWDQAIHGFREIEKAHWTGQNTQILQRVRDVAFPSGVSQLPLVHVLDLKADGYIKPHIDSIKFCGSTIAGLSLLSSSVMRLMSEQNKEHWADLLLERRSLYIISGRARYEFTHEILKDEDSTFNGQRVPRGRRIAVICRNLPEAVVGDSVFPSS
ncbi:alpha-ketoglutarate-dependent dioxygenase alkB homolog 7, mitochondrial isoform X2 [Pleurodeles waltl]